MKKKSKSSAPDKILYNFKVKGAEYLSQFAQIPVVLYYTKNDKKYYLHFSTAEAAFQYFKTLAKPFREKIIETTTGSKARYFGSAKAECPMRSNWDTIRKKVMRRVVFAKFAQNLHYQHRLIATDSAELIELSPWDKEKFWGVDNDGEGKNTAGKITMAVRDKLQHPDYAYDPDHHLFDMTEFM